MEFHEPLKSTNSWQSKLCWWQTEDHGYSVWQTEQPGSVWMPRWSMLAGHTSLSSKKTFCKIQYSLSLLKLHIILLFLARALGAGIPQIYLQRHTENRCYSHHTAILTKCWLQMCSSVAWDQRVVLDFFRSPQAVIQSTYRHQTGYIINNI